MKVERFSAPKGTRDVLPPESDRWAELVVGFAGQVGRAGYGLLVSPMFEDVGVFARMGEGTDVVRKEMYEFEDRGGRRMALRPEGTASAVRAWVQHRPPLPWKVWYVAPNFRYEAPQAGRYRQHHQLGVELLGVDDPDADVEVIVLLWEFLCSLGLQDLELVVNTMGTPEDRGRYAARLSRWLAERAESLDPEDRQKIDTHPLRVLDSKRPATVAATREAPALVDAVSAESRRRFERVLEGLTGAGVPHRVDPRLVRGLDYYTHTTFEIRSAALDAAQNTLGGGGRYDGLVEALGGPPTPGLGFGCGVERVLLACDREGVFPCPERRLDAFVVDVVDGSAAREITLRLRKAGFSVDRAWGGRSMKSQMRAADRSGARVAVIVGEDEASSGEVTLRDLRSDGGAVQKRIARSELESELGAWIGRSREVG
ncbi:MAG: histidine--tRNA ligase [Acidimicrobiales bacterium]|nr:MAG: histidine--tRNA ligase [Acidimicrobiales bacterium]